MICPFIPSKPRNYIKQLPDHIFPPGPETLGLEYSLGHNNVLRDVRNDDGCASRLVLLEDDKMYFHLMLAYVIITIIIIFANSGIKCHQIDVFLPVAPTRLLLKTPPTTLTLNGGRYLSFYCILWDGTHIYSH